MADRTNGISEKARHPWRQRMLGLFLIAIWALVKAFGRSIDFPTEQPAWFVVPAILGFVALIIGVPMLLIPVRSFDPLYEASSRQVSLFRAVSGLIVVAAVVQSVAFGFPAVRGTLPEFVRYIIIGAYVLVAGTAAIACILSLTLTWRAADRPDTRALALFMALLAFFWGPVLGRFWVGFESGSMNFGTALGRGSGWGSLSQVVLILSVAAFLRFSALFPRRLTGGEIRASRLFKPLAPIQRTLLHPAIVWGVAIGLGILLLTPQEGGGSGIPLSEVEPTYLLVGVVVGILFVGLPLVGMAAGALNLRSGYVSSVEAERKKILWVVVGCVGSAGMVLTAVGAFFLSSVPLFDLAGFLVLGLPFAPLVLVVSLAIAVFYRGSIHPALVIKRSTVYGVLGVLLIAALSAAENLLSEILENALGFSNLVSISLLGAVIAVILIPLRAPLARWLGPLLPSDGG